VNPPDTDNSTDVYDAGAAVGYARPKNAASANLRLVPAFDACTSSNSTHGAPLALPSCNPPNPTSDHLTLGAPDVTGTPAISQESLDLQVQGESPINNTNGDQADVKIDLLVDDVRNQVSPFSDYAGELRGVLGLRIIDRYNGPTLSGAATVQDLDIPFNVTCVATGGSAGGTCNVSTTIDTLSAGTVLESRRANWQLKQFQLFDGGPDGDADTANNTLFMVQGAFIP
jgi:hypothetical protein